MTERFYSATLVTSEYRGDHGADVRIEVEVGPKESLADLLDRVIGSETDVLEFRLLRRFKEADRD